MQRKSPPPGAGPKARWAKARNRQTDGQTLLWSACPPTPPHKSSPKPFQDGVVWTQWQKRSLCCPSACQNAREDSKYKKRAENTRPRLFTSAPSAGTLHGGLQLAAEHTRKARWPWLISLPPHAPDEKSVPVKETAKELEGETHIKTPNKPLIRVWFGFLFVFTGQGDKLQQTSDFSQMFRYYTHSHLSCRKGYWST